MLDELDELSDAYFRSQGFDPAVTQAVGLPSDPARVEPGRVIDWLEHHLEAGRRRSSLPATAARPRERVAELELRTGRLVVEANQVLLCGS